MRIVVALAAAWSRRDVAVARSEGVSGSLLTSIESLSAELSSRVGLDARDVLGGIAAASAARGVPGRGSEFPTLVGAALNVRAVVGDGVSGADNQSVGTEEGVL